MCCIALCVSATAAHHAEYMVAVAYRRSVRLKKVELSNAQNIKVQVTLDNVHLVTCYTALCMHSSVLVSLISSW
jgi:hypothetical protein